MRNFFLLSKLPILFRICLASTIPQTGTAYVVALCNTFAAIALGTTLQRCSLFIVSCFAYYFRYLAHGSSQSICSCCYRIGRSTACKIIGETCRALHEVLDPLYRTVSMYGCCVSLCCHCATEGQQSLPDSMCSGRRAQHG